MKKIFTYLILTTIINISVSCEVFASTFGTYKPEYEYGLFDGIKFNLLNKKKGEKILDVKDDVDKRIEQTKTTKEAQDKKDDDEYQMYKFMLENTIAL